MIRCCIACEFTRLPLITVSHLFCIFQLKALCHCSWHSSPCRHSGAIGCGFVFFAMAQTYFEGLFCSPGQPARTIALVQADGSLKILWNAPSRLGNAHGMHDFIQLEGEEAGLILAFHSSGRNDRRTPLYFFHEGRSHVFCDFLIVLTV